MSAQIPEVRRNLSLAACEPCRKAKVRCGHQIPHCDRCCARGLRQKCVYRAGEELTVDKVESAFGYGDRSEGDLEKRLRRIERGLQNVQKQLQPSKLHRASRKRSREVSSADDASHSFYTSEKASDSQSPLEPPGSQQLVDEHSSEDDEIRKSGGAELGFLGPSSSASALQDLVSELAHFRFILHDRSGGSTQIPVERVPWPFTSDEWQFTQSRVDIGVRILESLPPKILRDQLLLTFFETYDQIRPLLPKPWAKKVHKDLSDLLEPKGPRFPMDLTTVAKQIEINERKKLHLAGDAPVTIQWNLIGMLCAVFAVGELSQQSMDNSDDPANDEGSIAFARRMRDVVGLCWRLSNPLETIDEGLIVLLYLYITLHTILGDFSPFVWHLHGLLVNAVTALGLHHEDSQHNREINFKRVQRRRMEYAAIYTLDKRLSTFTGRPPLLLRRYSTALLPLDITDEEALLPDSEREAVMTQLTADGWNSYGRVSPTSFSRAQMIVGQAREDVLELMLTSSRKIDVGVVSDTQRRIIEHYNSLPQTLKYDHDGVTMIKEPSLYVQKIMIYLVSLESSFLLHKTVASKNRLGVNDPGLLKVSQRMLDTMVRLWELRAYYENFIYPLSWLLTAHAFPAASVLSAHLLSNPQRAISEDSVYSVSHHLHNLHHFLEALENSKSSDSHLRFCQKAHQIFSKVQAMLTDGTPTEAPPQTDHQKIDPSDASFLNRDDGNSGSQDPFSWMTGLDQDWLEYGASYLLPFETQDEAPGAYENNFMGPSQPFD